MRIYEKFSFWLKVRRGRDPQGLYAAKHTGGMAGVSIPVELPEHPHLRLTDKISSEDAARLVLDTLSHADSLP